MIYWYLLVPVNCYTYNILNGRMQNFIILFNKNFFFRNCNKKLRNMDGSVTQITLILSTKQSTSNKVYLL